ncbi:glycosyltransferase [Hydrococcus rivularis]|uniref:glycosyltransferase n=1 Tax=Hydrococcus rivularis TaxID=1616834 RepID=UPI000B1B10AF|nr:glycosyltransferase [Hydrococcus rivularis]
MSGVSIIIPALNESATLGRTLRHLSLLDPPAREIIVVDGGSQDNTPEIAKAAGVTVLISDCKGRSLQMNRGAEVATGEILCFLHADTLVPDDLVTVIEKTLADRSVTCGGFISLMAGTNATRWGVTLHNYLKTYVGDRVGKTSVKYNVKVFGTRQHAQPDVILFETNIT